MKWLRKLIKPSIVKVDMENVAIHVVHPYRSVPIYTISWNETVRVDGEVIAVHPKSSYTAMALGKQYTYSNESILQEKINSLLK